MNKSQLARELRRLYPHLQMDAARVEINRAAKFKSTIAHGLKAVRSRSTPEEPIVIDEPGVYGVISDIHFPYHDEAALCLAIEHLERVGCAGLIVNGDAMDCYVLSRFDKDPREPGLAEELGMMAKFLQLVTSVFPRVWWKLGNHEARLDSLLMTRAPELVGLPGMSLFEMVQAIAEGPLDFQPVGSKQMIRLGRLNVLHGHEFGHAIFSPVNPARGLFLRAKCSTLAGHHHQTSEHAESNINGDAMGCWTTGCLCSLRPSYAPFAFSKWNHGFAIVKLESSGRFTVSNHRIIDECVH